VITGGLSISDIFYFSYAKDIGYTDGREHRRMFGRDWIDKICDGRKDDETEKAIAAGMGDFDHKDCVLGVVG